VRPPCQLHSPAGASGAALGSQARLLPNGGAAAAPVVAIRIAPLVLKRLGRQRLVRRLVGEVGVIASCTELGCLTSVWGGAPPLLEVGAWHVSSRFGRYCLGVCAGRLLPAAPLRLWRAGAGPRWPGWRLTAGPPYWPSVGGWRANPVSLSRASADIRRRIVRAG